MRRFGSQQLLHEHPMIETLLKQIKRRRASSGCPVVGDNSTSPANSSSALLTSSSNSEATAGDNQVCTALSQHAG